MPSTINIERVHPVGPGVEAPFQTANGYKMADQANGPQRHTAPYAIYVKTLPEVAAELRAGKLLWMKQPGKRETLISADKLKGY